MKNCLSILFLLFMVGYTFGQTYTPVAVTGYNHDVVAEGNGNNSLTNTSKEMDFITISNNVICTKQFAAANAMPSTYGIPDNGTIVTGTHNFQMAALTGNNTLHLLTQETGTLTIGTPDVYSRISLLLTSTEGSSTLTITFNFADGTNFVSNSQVVTDWVNNYTNVALSGFGRIRRKAGPYAVGEYEMGGVNPRLYYKDYTLPCNKLLVSITFKNISSTIPASGSNRAFIFGVAGVTTVMAAAPAATGIGLCTAGPATLSVNSPSPDLTYNWSTRAVGGTAIGTGTSITTGTVTRDSTFYVAAVNNAGCVSDFTPVKVTILPAPAVPVVTGVKLCTASTASFTIENPEAGNTYNWYASTTDGTVIGNGTSFTSGILTKDSTFSVVALSSAACRSSATAVTVSFVAPPSAPAVSGFSLCPGEPATLTVNNPQTGITYNWFSSAAGGTAAGSGTSFTFLFTGGSITWYVTASSNSSCTSNRSPATITAFSPLPEPIVTSTDLGADKVTFTWLPVSGATGYQVSVNGGPVQSPSSGATGTTHTITGIPYLSMVTIKVTALGPKPCQNSDPGLASAKMLPSEIFIPNTFTPNADGRNDYFTVYGNAISGIALKIFNQWGELIFSTTQLGKAWDGTYKGKQQPVGIYVYAISITLSNGEQVIRKGDINLIR